MICRTSSRTVSSSLAPAELFARLAPGAEDAVLLESADGAGVVGASSFLFTKLAVRLEVRGDEVTVIPTSDGGRSAADALAASFEGEAEIARGGDGIVLRFLPHGAATPLEVLRRASRGWSRTGDAAETLCLPVIFSYDLASRFEALPPPNTDVLGFPDVVAWLPQEEVVIEHQGGTARVVIHEYGRDATAGGTKEALARLLVAVEAPDETVCGAAPGGFWKDGRQGGAVVTDLDDETFAALVCRLQEHIVAGDVFQIVPSRTFRAPCSDPYAAYLFMRRENPSPYLFFARAPGFVLFGASPETCVRVDGASREVSIRPIAGTRPRGRNSAGAIDRELDTRLEAELRLDAKENSEHMMLVDLARNDVARISTPGTRSVRALLEVVRYSHVMHLESVVTGELRPGLDALDAYAAVANMGTLVGAPKIEAARLLRRYERDARGPYGGAIGTLGSNGSLDTAIVIRAALVRDGVAFVRAGAGVVHASSPLAEAAETRAKAAAPLAAAISTSKGAK